MITTKYQASKNTPDGWILVAGSDESLEACVDEVKKEIGKLTTIEQALGDYKKTCKQCGKEATLKEGIGKNGKPYKMIKCSEGHVEWVH